MPSAVMNGNRFCASARGPFSPQGCGPQCGPFMNERNPKSGVLNKKETIVNFQPKFLATAIGSLPHGEPGKAVDVVLNAIARCADLAAAFHHGAARADGNPIFRRHAQRRHRRRKAADVLRYVQGLFRSLRHVLRAIHGGHGCRQRQRRLLGDGDHAAIFQGDLRTGKAAQERRRQNGRS